MAEKVLQRPAPKKPSVDAHQENIMVLGTSGYFVKGVTNAFSKAYTSEYAMKNLRPSI